MEEVNQAKLYNKIVGQHLRFHRDGARMSQHELAQCLGVTFQQIQKYERGTNRVSVGALKVLCHTMKVDLDTFVKETENLYKECISNSGGHSSMPSGSVKSRRLAKLYDSINSNDVREKVYSLVEEISKHKF